MPDDDRLIEDVQVIFRQTPKVSGSGHFGSRLVFAPDGKLFVTLGERFNHRDKAQDLDATFGKVVRINADGSVPEDNPFVGKKGALPEIWSYGHRNPQSAAINPATGKLWIVEHGARGGDELNIPEPGTLALLGFGLLIVALTRAKTMLPADGAGVVRPARARTRRLGLTRVVSRADRRGGTPSRCCHRQRRWCGSRPRAPSPLNP